MEAACVHRDDNDDTEFTVSVPLALFLVENFHICKKRKFEYMSFALSIHCLFVAVD